MVPLQRLPDLLLALVVGVDSERHQLVERDAVVGIDLEHRRADRRQTQPLLHDRHGHEEGGRDLLLAHGLLAHGLEGAELVQRVQRRALDVLGETVFLGQTFRADDARNGCVLRQALLLGEQLQRAEAPAAGGHLVDAGLGARFVEHRPNGEGLEQGAPGDVLGELLDGDARLHLTDVALGQHELVERDRTLLAQADLRLGLGHDGSP